MSHGHGLCLFVCFQWTCHSWLYATTLFSVVFCWPSSTQNHTEMVKFFLFFTSLLHVHGCSWIRLANLLSSQVITWPCFLMSVQIPRSTTGPLASEADVLSLTLSIYFFFWHTWWGSKATDANRKQTMVSWIKSVCHLPLNLTSNPLLHFQKLRATSLVQVIRKWHGQLYADGTFDLSASVPDAEGYTKRWRVVTKYPFLMMGAGWNSCQVLLEQ